LTVLTSSLQRAALLGYAPAQVRRPRAQTGAPPTVSVVVPCYNYGHFLPRCVASILDQPGVDVEVVIVDDRSTDDSATVAAELAAGDSRIRTIFHETNKRHIATYNDGLAVVTGDYVVLLSADDLLAPGALGRATALMSAYPSVGLVYGRVVDFVDEPPPARAVARSWTVWSGDAWIADRCRTGRNALRSAEAVMRTSVLRKVGGYRADLPHAADFAMWLAAAAVSDVGYVGGADQAYYRVHQANMHHAVFDVGQTDGLVRDLRERLACFEVVLSDEGTAELLARARRSLAAEALTLAIRSYGWGLADRWPVAALSAFARETCPPWQLSGLWRALRRREAVGERRSRRHPLFMPTEVVHRARHRVDVWRWRWAGV
jgi:hypothetical protein